MILTVSIEQAPKEFNNLAVRIALVHKKLGSIPSETNTWQVEITKAPNRKGELVWQGDTVQHHGDGRRFIYFAWTDHNHKQFRRLKLYLDHIPENTTDIRIAGSMPKDGSPACSTAKLI
ncbi:MAG: DUF5990 family protein [Fimbriimonadaceae bacterium]